MPENTDLPEKYAGSMPVQQYYMISGSTNVKKYILNIIIQLVVFKHIVTEEVKMLWAV